MQSIHFFFWHLWCGQISIPVIMCMLPHCHNMWWIQDTKDSFPTTQKCRSFAQKSSPVRPSGIWLQATHASNKVQLEEFQAANSWQRHQEHKIGAATRNEHPSSDWHQSSIMAQSTVPLFCILPFITTISHAAEPETTKKNMAPVLKPKSCQDQGTWSRRISAEDWLNQPIETFAFYHCIVCSGFLDHVSSWLMHSFHCIWVINAFATKSIISIILLWHWHDIEPPQFRVLVMNKGRGLYDYTCIIHIIYGHVYIIGDIHKYLIFCISNKSDIW